jgi:hypothetical protein
MSPLKNVSTDGRCSCVFIILNKIESKESCGNVNLSKSFTFLWSIRREI